jgi:hypothetical protein
LGTQSLASGAPLSFNDLLKEHRKVQEQQATVARQQKQIEALTAGLQKVRRSLRQANLYRKLFSTIVKEPRCCA